jgi:S-adenosylmethionine:tRNA ribosyltransferase-isomerase
MDFDFLEYDLPEHLIAQEPAAERDASRLMVVDRANGRLSHRVFRDLPDLLQPGDLLVLNDTRVLPARLIGRRERTGGRWEGLFLRALIDGTWEMLARTGGRPVVGETINIEPGPLKLTICGRSGGHWLVDPTPRLSVAQLLNECGQIPLPPYIRKGTAHATDRQRYQTVFARVDGSVAAPTAGLHFTPTLFEKLRKRGVQWANVTLHVGLGTFEPIKSDDPALHKIHAEIGGVPETTVAAIRDCKLRGNRVIAVGTTATRALESAACSGKLEQWQGSTNIFIRPPYNFRVIDALITNFHLPRTTLLLLVAALAGDELTKRAYQDAVDNQFRFFSYGDAMFIV